jgi:hypothetical protein
MPTLQVRDLSEDLYLRLSMIAREENRGIAQEAVVLLKESLGLHTNNKFRRRALLKRIKEKHYPDTFGTNDAEWICANLSIT